MIGPRARHRNFAPGTFRTAHNRSADLVTTLRVAGARWTLRVQASTQPYAPQWIPFQ